MTNYDIYGSFRGFYHEKEKLTLLVIENIRIDIYIGLLIY
jgi:hypothetical protein